MAWLPPHVHDLVGEDLLAGYHNGFTSWYRVLKQERDRVLVTPVYEQRHNRVFDSFPIAEAREMLTAGRELAREWAEQQAAEIRAETNIPQHLVW
jgi:hypothetical protein